MEPGTIVIVVIGAVLLIGIVILVVVGLRSPDASDPLMQRLAEYAESGKPVDLEEIELSQPFAERVIIPIARKLGELVVRFTPQNSIQDTAKKLEMAGNPRGWDPTVFYAARI